MRKGLWPETIGAGLVLCVATTIVLTSTASGVPAPQSTTPASRLIDAGQLLDDLAALSADEMEGRRARTPGNARARGLIVRRFQEAGLQPVGESFEWPFGTGEAAPAASPRGVNVVGRLVRRGTAPTRTIVVSAHYDHLGIRSGQVFNGANDNASGTAALAVLARALATRDLQSSILFVAFDAEEEGLAGARAFVRRPPVPLETIVANINLDMIGRDASRTLWAVGARRFPFFDPIVRGVAATAPIRLVAGHDDPADRAGDWSEDSDHYAFAEAGIPALYLGVDDSRYHHRPDDDVGSMMPDFYVGAVETIAEVILAVDRSGTPAPSANGPMPR